MGRPRIQNCKVCGHPSSKVGTLSYRKKCPACGERAQIQNRRQLIAAQGPYFDHWRERLAASLGARLDGPRDHR